MPLNVNSAYIETLQSLNRRISIQTRYVVTSVKKRTFLYESIGYIHLMNNLCCVLATNRVVDCVDCKTKWCWDCWHIDRTHRDISNFERCPVSGKKVMWDEGFTISGRDEHQVFN